MATVARLTELWNKAESGQEVFGLIRDDPYADTDDREAYRAELDRAERNFLHQAKKDWPRIIAAIEALLAENERLAANLREHGEHIPSCPSRGDVPEHADCDCGLAKALKGFGVGC